MSLPLLLLPGMMCDARLFSPQIAHFSAQRAVQVAPMVKFSTFHELAEEVLQHAPARFALAGLSMGGILAMEMMRLAPERVTQLALLDTNPRAELPEVKKRREPQIRQVQQGGLRTVMRDELKPNYLSEGPNRAGVLDICMAMAETLGPAVFVRQSRALQQRRDQQDTLSKVRVPTLILCGEDDTLCPLERHEQMHALIPGSTLTVIAGAGHLPTLEQPDPVNQALQRWIDADA